MMAVQSGRFGGFACQYDPFAANRTFFLRGKGTVGAKPATDDIGNALTYFGDTAISSTAPLYWSDYQTTMRPASGRIVMPASRWDVGLSGSPFSILIRMAVFGSVGPSSGTIIQNALTTSAWGSGGVQHNLWITGGGALVWQFYGSSSPSGISMTAPSGSWVDHAFREVLITYDGTTTSGYCNGTRLATTTGSYAKVASTSACVGSAVDGSGALTMAFVDLTVYNACITTASSYTLPTRAPCQ